MKVKELKILQDSLSNVIKTELDEPMVDFKHVKNMLKVLEDVDCRRRKAWNDEKFEEHDNMANVVFNNFNSDDIPF